MTTQELVEKSIFKIHVSGLHTQHLIASEDSPLEEEDICGCWLLAFESEDSMSTWLDIYKTFIEVVASNAQLNAVVNFEPIHKLDNTTLCQNRGFNEAYTTDHYAEFLEDGDCEPNEWIVDHIDKLKKALNQQFDFQFKSEHQKRIIDELIKKAFIKPNLEMKWTDEPFPWTLYLVPISENNVSTWSK